MLLIVLSLDRPILEIIAPRLYILLAEVVFSLTTGLLFVLLGQEPVHRQYSDYHARESAESPSESSSRVDPAWNG